MATAPIEKLEEIKPSRWVKLSHPLLMLCASAFACCVIPSVFWLMIFYVFAVQLSPTGNVPGFYPMLQIGSGLLVGTIYHLLEKPRLRRSGEATARLMAFPELRRRALRANLGEVLRFFLAIGLIGLLNYLLLLFFDGMLFRQSVGYSWMISVGMLFLSIFFTYPEHWLIYQRARELARQPFNPAEPARDFTHAPAPRWPMVFGTILIIAALAGGAWLQWGLPASWQREPTPFTTQQQVGGKITRLTYNTSADLPAVSPDGRQVAYIRSTGVVSRLELMDLAGQQKRQVGTIWPDGYGPPAWSPDSKQLLVVGDPAQEIAIWEAYPDDNDTARQQLWLVDAASGRAEKLSDLINFTGAIWADGGRRIVGLRELGGDGRLWLADAAGRNAHEVKELTLANSISSLQLWREGREVLAIGSQEQPGIWSVNVVSGKPTKYRTWKSGGPRRWMTRTCFLVTAGNPAISSRNRIYIS